jgi:hypothetical protein
MMVTIAILLAFGAGFVVRSLMDRDPKPEIGQGYGSDRYHSYDCINMRLSPSDFEATMVSYRL